MEFWNIAKDYNVQRYAHVVKDNFRDRSPCRSNNTLQIKKAQENPIYNNIMHIIIIVYAK